MPSTTDNQPLSYSEINRIAKCGVRHLVMIDIENLAGPSPSTLDVQVIEAGLRDLVPCFDRTQRIVACSHHAAATVAFEFRGARHLWRSGQDGADLALIDVLKNEHVDERFAHVTICSGDGIFAEDAARLQGKGVDVTVVSLRGYLAARLRLAARHVRYLTPGVANASAASAV
jgi:hypothetical protein